MKKLFLMPVLALFLVGCGKNSLLVDITTYRSYPSFYYDRERDFYDERLKLLKDNGILFELSFSGVGNPNFRMYLGLTSLENNNFIKVKKAIITSKKEEIKETYNKEISIGYFNEELATYGRGFLLFEFSEEKMLELTKDGNATLEVFYEFPESGKAGSKIFEIERYEYKDIAWPT